MNLNDIYDAEMMTPEKASKKRMLRNSGAVPVSRHAVVVIMDIHITGSISGNDITVKRVPRFSAFETIAPSIVETDAMAMLPHKTVSRN